MANYVSRIVSAGTSLNLEAQDTATGTHIQSAGTMRVSSGAEATSTYISGGGVVTVASHGRVESTIVYSNGTLQGWTYYYGGEMINTTVHSGGRVVGFQYTGAGSTTISEIRDNRICGDFANATITSGYNGYIGSNGRVSSATINGGGSMTVDNGGSALYAQVKSAGYMLVDSGGDALQTLVSGGGVLVVASHGRAENTIVYSNGTLQGWTYYYGGEMINTTVHSGGRVVGFQYTGAGSTTISEIRDNRICGDFANATIASGYNGYIGSDGRVSSATINGSGSMSVENGGSALYAQVKSGGKVIVDSGGLAQQTHVSGGGVLTVASLGRIESTIVYSNGTLQGWTHYYGGEMINTTVHSGGRVVGFQYTGAGSTTISEINDNRICGDFVNGTIASGYNGYIGSNGRVSSATINGGGSMSVENGGSALYAQVKSTGYMVVDSGGLALQTQVSSGGVLTVASHGRVESTIVFSRGTLQGWTQYYGGEMINTTVQSGGRVVGFLYTGAGSTTISEIRDNRICGDFVNGTIESKYNGYIGSNGRVSSATINGGGSMSVENGGSALSTQVKSAGSMFVESGGSALQTQVSSGGVLTVSRYGAVDGTIVSSGGTLKGAPYGGVMANTTVQSGGSMVLTNGTSLSGTARVGGTMIVSSGVNVQDSYIYMNVSERKTTDGVIINNIGLISSANFCITVSAAQTAGSYQLAAGAASFSKSISVYNSNNTLLGTFTSSNLSFNSGGRTYTLSNSSGTLSFSVAGTPTPTPTTDVRTNLLSNGYSQIVAWDSAEGKVGYVATNGQTAPAWTGIWEWGGSEAAMWKVVAVGHFSNDVKKDGVLLYNGIGNTFAAWTDLGRGDYGYVSLCHVDGNFQTLTLADFDGNGLDDVIIYDEKGSFGIVSDAAAYHDVWHVDNAATNVQQVIGAGYFGNADGRSDILVKKTDENAYFLWHNQDPMFATWNWSQTYLGTLDNDWSVAAIGDFQGDGIDDIIMWQKSTGDMYAWEDGKAATQRWVGRLDSADWEVAAVGDYNGDGKEDLLLRELVSGWGGVGYWAGANASNWTDLNARIETDMESKFAVVA